MSDNQHVKFGDVVDIAKESVDRANNPYERYVEGGHMDSASLKLCRWGVFGDDYVGPAFHRVFKKGQILYGSRRTYLKKVAVAEFDGITANTTFVITPKKNEFIRQELIPYLMLSDRFTNHSVLNSKGSTNPYVNWSDIARFPLNKISNSKQNEILNILKVAETVVFTAQDTLRETERLQLALLKSAFSPSDDWTKFKLLDICSIKGGRQRAPKYELGKNPISYLRPANIKKGRFRSDDIKSMDFTEDELNEYQLKSGDVLLVEGGEAEDVGDALFWKQHTEERFAFQNTLIRLRADTNLISTRTLYWLMVYLHRTGFFMSIAAGTKIKHIGSKNTSHIGVRLPNDTVALQQNVELLDELDSTIEALEIKIAEAKKMLQNLINLYLD